MSEADKIQWPLHQAHLHARCVHPTGSFSPFTSREVEQSIPARFEQQVVAYPDRLAVKTLTSTLTYAELNRQANRIAHAVLHQLGPLAAPVVLLCAHDAPVIAAIFGALKAGKSYVPLDPTFPPARLSAMLEDVQAGLILTDNQHDDLATTIAAQGHHVLNVERLGREVSSQNPTLPLTPDLLAYILYTSGSTGVPKGVMQNHRNVLHMTRVLTNLFHICAEDRVTHLVSYSFVTAARNIFSALLNGAVLYPFALDKGRNIPQMAHWLSHEKLTIFTSSATLFRHFVDTLTGAEMFPTLRLLQVGGEPIYPRDVERYKRHFSSRCLFVANLGATEISPICEYFIDKHSHVTGPIVPVGYAPQETVVRLLDEEGREVGTNHVGEIAVQSPYLALGYWQQPALTAQAFRHDPTGSGTRLYCTGDLGRWRPDGCLEYIGRQDFRAKVRGYRIEVAEVESALLSLSGIKDAAVVTQEMQPGEHRLVAYIVPAPGPTPTTSELRQRLGARLPDYMVPAAFMMRDALPLTASGKIDRQALRVAELTRQGLAVPYVAPRTFIEAQLVNLWTEVLAVESVGVHDPFLDLGGDSLLAMRLVTRVCDRWQVEISPATLLKLSTVAEMASALTQPLLQGTPQAEFTRWLEEIEGLSTQEVQKRLADSGNT